VRDLRDALEVWRRRAGEGSSSAVAPQQLRDGTARRRLAQQPAGGGDAGAGRGRRRWAAGRDGVRRARIGVVGEAAPHVVQHLQRKSDSLSLCTLCAQLKSPANAAQGIELKLEWVELHISAGLQLGCCMCLGHRLATAISETTLSSGPNKRRSPRAFCRWLPQGATGRRRKPRGGTTGRISGDRGAGIRGTGGAHLLRTLRVSGFQGFEVSPAGSRRRRGGRRARRRCTV